MRDLTTDKDTKQRNTDRRHPYIQADNAASLEVYRRLRQAVDECEPHAAPYLNVVAVFFHDLVFILTGYDLRLREIDSPYRPQTPAEWRPVKRLPYLDFADAENGIAPEAKIYGIIEPEVRRSRRWGSAISRVVGPLVGARRTVAIAKPSALNPRHLSSAIVQGRMQVTFPSPLPLAIPGLSRQMEHLDRCIEEMADALGWPGSPARVMEVVGRHIRALAVEGDPQPVSYQALICGSLAEPFNRLLAARARAAGVSVVEVSHGGGDGMYDEPLYGYGERSFATAVLGFGPAGGELLGAAEYVESLNEDPSYIESDEPGVKGLYQGPEVSQLGSLDGKRVFYVPTSFAGCTRYGPFHDIPDRMYLQWQEQVFRAFPDAVWKSHPKDATAHGLVPRGARRVVEVPFRDCLHEADVFVFDYLSTAFCLAAATSKPIIFLDIGLRNLSRAAEQAVADRCIAVQADPENPGDLKEQILSLRQKQCVNTFSSRFSLATSPSRSGGRVEAALEIVKRQLGNA